MNLRQFARGKPCLIRIPGVCNHDPETTVLCHLRMAGISGMGLKAHDLLGAWGCSDCHRYCDTHGIDGRTALLEGMARTLHQLIERGLIHVHSSKADGVSDAKITHEANGGCGAANAALIAACDPDTIRALLEERDALRAALKWIVSDDTAKGCSDGMDEVEKIKGKVRAVLANAEGNDDWGPDCAREDSHITNAALMPQTQEEPC